MQYVSAQLYTARNKLAGSRSECQNRKASCIVIDRQRREQQTNQEHACFVRFFSRSHHNYHFIWLMFPLSANAIDSRQRERKREILKVKAVDTKLCGCRKEGNDSHSPLRSDLNGLFFLFHFFIQEMMCSFTLTRTRAVLSVFLRKQCSIHSFILASF